MAKLAIHYAGELVWLDGRGGCTHVLPGWAACCYGKRTEKIRATCQHTYDRALVTCKKCLAYIRKEDPAWRAQSRGRRG